MDFKVGDLVTRCSHNNDITFKIVKIYDDKCELKGINVRLLVDSFISDLKMYDGGDIEEEKPFLNRVFSIKQLDRNDFFYLPGKVVHIDSDKEYLKRCLDYYKDINIWAVGVNITEKDMEKDIIPLLKQYKTNKTNITIKII